MFHRVVGSESQARASLPQGVPGIAFVETLFSQDAGRPAHVSQQVAGLHGGNHAQLFEPGEVVAVDELRVLDLVAGVAAFVNLERSLESVQRHAVGAVADGVQRNLEAGGIAIHHHLLQLLRVIEQDAAVVGGVGERLQHGGGERTAATVGDALEGAGLEPGVGRAPFFAHFFQLVERSVEGQPLGYAQGEHAFLLQLAQGQEIFPRRVVLNGGDAVARRFRQGQQQAALALLGGRSRNQAADETSGVFFQPAGGLAVGVADDFAAFGLLAAAGDAGLLQRKRVGDRRVPVHAGEQHRVRGGNRI